MNWKFAIAAAFAGALFATAQPIFAEDVVIKVWARADRSGPLRAGNIVAAGVAIRVLQRSPAPAS